MSDLIDRQAAIDALRNINAIARPISISDDVLLIDKDEAMTELMMLPSAQPEPKRGTWIKYPSDSELYICSECASFWGSKDKFCRFCGAKMER